MNLLSDIITIIFSGLRKLSPTGLITTLLIATILSVGCFVLCDYYSRLWNKSFKKTITHNILSVLAAALTFIFVIAFASITFFQEISNIIILKWQTTVSFDKKWQAATFSKSYQAVKACCENSEPFDQYKDGKNIPLTTTKAQEVFARTYADEGSKHFNKTHPFLKIIWSAPQISQTDLEKDVQYYFVNIGKTYPPERAIELVAAKVKKHLKEQTPKVITLTRIILIVLFFFVQAVPFGLIGFASYNSLKVKV
jgi:hypothetical protein